MNNMVHINIYEDTLQAIQKNAIVAIKGPPNHTYEAGFGR